MPPTVSDWLKMASSGKSISSTPTRNSRTRRSPAQSAISHAPLYAAYYRDERRGGGPDDPGGGRRPAHLAGAAPGAPGTRVSGAGGAERAIRAGGGAGRPPRRGGGGPGDAE